MTGSRPAFLIAALGLMTVASWGWLRLESAQGVLDAAKARAISTDRDLDRLMRLRAHEAHVVSRSVPDSDLVSQIQGALTAAGLPASDFSGIQPLGDQLDPVSHVQQRSLQLRLNNLAPAELGAWLAAWLTPDRPWSVHGLAMAHPQDGGGPTLDSNRYAVTVTLLMRSLEDSP